MSYKQSQTPRKRTQKRGGSSGYVLERPRSEFSFSQFVEERKRRREEDTIIRGIWGWLLYFYFFIIDVCGKESCSNI